MSLATWLVVAGLAPRDEHGAIVMEDDNGWMNSHPRLVLELDAGRSYRVEVGALRGRSGPFRIACEAEEGEPPGRALRAAKLQLLREGELRDPRHWAAFTLAGDWR